MYCNTSSSSAGTLESLAAGITNSLNLTSMHMRVCVCIYVCVGCAALKSLAAGVIHARVPDLAPVQMIEQKL